MATTPPDRQVRRAAGGSLQPRWVPWLLIGLSAALLPVVVRTLSSVPPLYLARHWSLAWGGFDVGLACLLTATGVALFRRSPIAQVLAIRPGQSPSLRKLLRDGGSGRTAAAECHGCFPGGCRWSASASRWRCSPGSSGCS